MAGARNVNLTFIWVVISNEPLELLPEVVPMHNNDTKVPRILYETFILLATKIMSTVRFLGIFFQKNLMYSQASLADIICRIWSPIVSSLLCSFFFRLTL